ncbi:Spo0B domain-containing protein [Desulfitibacter alkalitolerans]|uniref:Spo0B domain-containing protein n=1 Tax=Desulfitibacter alkalitolerans TaxID=264641 RepID=UPI000483EB64|nr:Spo0B domain-containing protein [Desulfitibacter alkalitolerans]
MKEDMYRHEAIKLLRLQKHDMVNYLQVILGYIQLNKGNEAQKHIKQAMYELQHKGSILRIAYPKLVISLMSQADKVFRLGIPLSIACKNDLKNIHVDEELLTELLEKIWDEIIASQLRYPPGERHIDFMVDDDGSFVFSAVKIKTYIKTGDLNELNILFSKAGYELVLSDEKLIIRNIINRVNTPI